MRQNKKTELLLEEQNNDTPLISKPSKKVFDEANKRMGTLMLKGYTMLAEHCNGKKKLNLLFLSIIIQFKFLI